MSQPICRLVVIGAGLVGERHARLVAQNPRCQLVAIVDPRSEIDALARSLSCERLSDLAMLPDNACDAAIIATPNHNHFATAMACLERRLPCLIEKPITDDLAEGEKLVAAFEAASIAMLVGHHRRYHPFVADTKELLASGEIGHPVCASTIWAVKKPDSYFKAGAWRLGADGGPLMINFIHEIDLMRCLFGELIDVNALASNNQRQTPVEDTAAMLLRFEGGMIATAILSDAALTPWSFEGASGENPNIASTGISSWRIGCSKGAFEFPVLRVWKNDGTDLGDWSKPLASQQLKSEQVAPLERQLEHFIDLVHGVTDQPMVSGREGLNSLRATKAVMMSAQTNRRILLNEFDRKSIS
ncbi:MAG: Gfo/Idh/MocA family oxidoreductase [Pseudomonadota bacterium]